MKREEFLKKFTPVKGNAFIRFEKKNKDSKIIIPDQAEKDPDEYVFFLEKLSPVDESEVEFKIGDQLILAQFSPMYLHKDLEDLVLFPLNAIKSYGRKE